MGVKLADNGVENAHTETNVHESFGAVADLKLQPLRQLYPDPEKTAEDEAIVEYVLRVCFPISISNLSQHRRGPWTEPPEQT